MRSYAGIGKRRLTRREADLIRRIGSQLARDGFVLRTGAAPGADQEFAEGALAAAGDVVLCLPSSRHEKTWVDSVGERYGAQVRVETLRNDDHEAMQSVAEYHPIGDRLKGYTVRFHARNYRIVVGPTTTVDFVVAWPRPGGGGTAQGIRIAEKLNIPILHLDECGEAKAWASLRRLVVELGGHDGSA